MPSESTTTTTAPNPFKNNNPFTIPMDNDDDDDVRQSSHDPLPWERKAAEIEAKTRELKLREEEAQSRAIPNLSLNKNWPVCYPLLVHRIDEELPTGGRHLAQHSYAIWKLTALAYAILKSSKVLEP